MSNTPRKRTSKAAEPAPSAEEQRIAVFAAEQRLCEVAWAEPDGERIVLLLGLPAKEWWREVKTGDSFAPEVLRVTHNRVETR